MGVLRLFHVFMQCLCPFMFAIILTVSVLRLFSRYRGLVCSVTVIMVFPDHTHLFFFLPDQFK